MSDNDMINFWVLKQFQNGRLVAILNFNNFVIFTSCRSGDIREVLIFANSMRRTNSRIQESSENYYNSATKEKYEFANSKLREKSKNKKFAKKMLTGENYQIYSN